MKNFSRLQKRGLMKKDWTGSPISSVITVNGGRYFTKTDREKHDYYATDPEAIPPLVENETFSNTIWECACGELHLSDKLADYGYNVINSDLIVRGGGYAAVRFPEIYPYPQE